MPFVGDRSKGDSKASEAPTKKPPTSAVTRRRRIPVAVAGLFAVVLLATSFPFTALLSQHQQLAGASAELRQVDASNRALTERQHQLTSKAAIDRLAREEYQLVSPGQTLYDVLPANGRAAAAASAGLALSGDPGNQALVAPANAPDLSPQPDLSSPTPVAVPAAAGKSVPVGQTSVHASGTGSTPSTFWGRVTATLEFWK
jgi:cell division protein FtsB